MTTRFEFAPHELEVLAEAARLLNEIDSVRAKLTSTPLVVEGSTGQLRPSHWLHEIRAHRRAFAGLLRELDLPEDTGFEASERRSSRSSSGRALALARWRRPG